MQCLTLPGSVYLSGWHACFLPHSTRDIYLETDFPGVFQLPRKTDHSVPCTIEDPVLLCLCLSFIASPEPKTERENEERENEN